MKPQETLLASALIAVVAGAGAAFATGSLQKPAAPRGETEARSGSPERGEAREAASDDRVAVLQLTNERLEERVLALETRLAELSTQRSPLSAAVAPETSARVPVNERSLGAAAPIEVTPDFVESVGQALDSIRAKEDAEREAKRKEQQAQRIEERVTRLQQELGLSNRQSSDVRTALISQDDRREALFTSMRDGNGEPQDMREKMRAIRDDTYATLGTVLTPDQLTRYKEMEESDFGRRGWGGGDFGGGPGGPGGRGGSDSGRRPAR